MVVKKQLAHMMTFRHSISKLSHLHFVANLEYEKRLIQLGEDPKRIYNVGGVGIGYYKRNKISQ